jgi:hypothetical protein
MAEPPFELGAVKAMLAAALLAVAAPIVGAPGVELTELTTTVEDADEAL